MIGEIHSFINRKKGYFRYPLIFLSAVLITLSQLFAAVTPMTPAFIGSLSGADCIFAFLGSVFALTINGHLYEALPCLSAMLAIGAYRFLLGYNSAKWVGITSALLTGLSVGIIGIVCAAKPSEVVTAVASAFAAGTVSYCLTVTYRVMSSGRIFAAANRSYAAPCAVLILVVACLSGLTAVYELGVNLGVVFGTAAALTFANRSRCSGGAVCGVLTAAGVILASPDLAAGAAMLALAATAGAVFAKFGKITMSAGFIFILGLGVSAIGINSNTLAVMTAAAAGSILFIILPAGRIISRYPARQIRAGVSGEKLSEIFAERLKLAGTALSDVKSAVERAGEILDKRNSKDISWVYNSAADMVCRKCRHNMVCWGSEYGDNISFFNKLAARLRKGEALDEGDLPSGIEKRCEKRRLLVYALSDRYREYVTINTANRKMSEMRTVLTAQLGATESLMLEMSDEFRGFSHYDRALAARIEAVLEANGIANPKAAVMVSEGRISVEGFGKGELSCGAEQLCALISKDLQREFDLPSIIGYKNEFRFTMYERAVYALEYGACQLAKTNEKSCGDYYDSFVDGKGYAYVILSDGMGSGSRARIDSAFACGMLVKLLRSGIGLPSALEIINNSLLVKSSDESFATLDVCRVDLYTGKTEIFKAGAAPSYIRCKKRLVKASGKGLPVGIGYRAVYESQSFNVGDSDMIIMASDGAELNEKWLERELIGKNYVDAIDLNDAAKHLAETARYSAEKGREDDISVIAVKLVR